MDVAVGYTDTRTTGLAPALVRRLMIRCPVTGLATDTGLERSEVADAGSVMHFLVDCLECGQDHAWQKDDLMAPRNKL
jgi:hypothetical protein